MCFTNFSEPKLSAKLTAEILLSFRDLYEAWDKLRFLADSRPIAAFWFCTSTKCSKTSERSGLKHLCSFFSARQVLKNILHSCSAHFQLCAKRKKVQNLPKHFSKITPSCDIR